MKYFFLILFALPLTIRAQPVENRYFFYQLYQLDSIGKSSSFTRHFGELYFQFLGLVDNQLRKADTPTYRLVRHFQAVFARFYIDACDSFYQKKQISDPAWRTYFSDTTLTAAQYYLLGANAHLNGQLAEAIGNSYTPEEWKQLKKKYKLFNKCLNETYRYVFRETLRSSERTRWFHILSLGFDRITGSYYLYKWRKRQMRLTEYYFAGSVRYKKLFEKINSKKERIDKLVLTRF